MQKEIWPGNKKKASNYAIHKSAKFHHKLTEKKRELKYFLYPHTLIDCSVKFPHNIYTTSRDLAKKAN